MTSLPHSVRSASSTIEIDWTNGGSHSELMQWIENCPRPAGVRVFVSRRNSPTRVQRALQSLGCTVTYRATSSSYSPACV